MRNDLLFPVPVHCDTLPSALCALEMGLTIKALLPDGLIVLLPTDHNIRKAIIETWKTHSRHMFDPRQNRRMWLEIQRKMGLGNISPKQVERWIGQKSTRKFHVRDNILYRENLIAPEVKARYMAPYRKQPLYDSTPLSKTTR